MIDLIVWGIVLFGFVLGIGGGLWLVLLLLFGDPR